MLRVKDVAPGVVLELRYATTNNFTGKILYDTAECWLAEPAAKRLARVQKNLEKEGLGLKVWDCYRPLSVQQKLWDVVPDKRYVASPKTGSRHNRGCSVDLTLVDQQGTERPMPTAYDDFTPTAHRDYMNLPNHILANRKKLEDAMAKEGWLPLPTEWWHFDDPEWKNFELRNEPLKSPNLKKEERNRKGLNPIPKSTTQLVVVTSPNWKSKIGTLRRYERNGSSWTMVGSSWPITLGSRGLKWGQGLHRQVGEGFQKREGDKATPAGVFPIGKGYGYPKEAPDNSQWPYQQVDKTWRCVDDPTSGSYNQILQLKKKNKPAWKSAEKMKRRDQLYKWVINIEQNWPAVLKGCGSCIFFHVWKRKDAPTAGCVAMGEENMRLLLSWLKPEADAMTTILPQSIYTKVKRKWKLP